MKKHVEYQVQFKAEFGWRVAIGGHKSKSDKTAKRQAEYLNGYSPKRYRAVKITTEVLS